MTTTRWTTPDDIRAGVRKVWDSGRILRSVVDGTQLFPLRVALRRPTSVELSVQFDAARAWIAGIRSIRRVTIEWQPMNHRQLGKQEAPTHVVLETADDAAALIGRSAELIRFRQLAASTTAEAPELSPFVARCPLDVLAAAADWASLVAVVRWVAEHPRPHVYIRQLDLPGVHTKLVEQHRKLITAMLNTVLPADAVDYTARPGDFARRFGFRSKPRLVRFRFLDPSQRLTGFDTDGDYQLTAADFGRMPCPRQVFLTENEVNYLAFPSLPGSVVVFGAGSGLEHLAGATWLSVCPHVYYWGDIDTHGFWILDQLRAVVPSAASFLMDRATLFAHEPFWGTEPVQRTANLTRLTTREQQLYDDLRDNGIRDNLRLEQEHIAFSHLQNALTTRL